jgi:hypothetical protein
MFVYVAGPLTQGNVRENIHNAMTASHKLMDMGCEVFVPHLCFFLDMHTTRPYNEWLDMDFRIIRSKADCLFALPGYSPGTDKEKELAYSLGKPVFITYEAVKAYKESMEVN